MRDSPFAPTFGSWPPVLAGRTDLRDDLEMAFQAGPRSEWYTALTIGNRGTGKTVALSLASDLAAQEGFHVIYDVAHAGLIQRLTASLKTLEGKPPKRKNRVELALGIPGATLTASSESEVAQDSELHFRATLAESVDRVINAGATGILLVIDELHDGETEELSTLGAAIQIITRINAMPLAFVGAGLPELDQRVLDTPGTTFLERCARYDTTALGTVESRNALQTPFIDAGIGFSETGMNNAITATAGHPFAIQSIGHHIWAKHPDSEKTISIKTFQDAIEKGLSSMGRQVAQPVWKRLSETDQKFVLAMARHPNVDVPVSYIASELDRDPKWVSRYRNRLIKAAVIKPASRGHITFAHPAFRSWIQANAGDLNVG